MFEENGQKNSGNTPNTEHDGPTCVDVYVLTTREGIPLCGVARVIHDTEAHARDAQEVEAELKGVQTIIEYMGNIRSKDKQLSQYALNFVLGMTFGLKHDNPYKEKLIAAMKEESTVGDMILICKDWEKALECELEEIRSAQKEQTCSSEGIPFDILQAILKGLFGGDAIIEKM